MGQQVSYDEHGVDLSMHDLSIEQQESDGRMEVRRIEKITADRDRIQSINAMLVGQISRLMYAFNPEGEGLDPVDPNKNLEAVVGEVIDQAIKVFTDPQLGHGQIIALTREAKVLMSVIKDHQEYQSNIRKAIVASGLLEGVRDLDSMHLDETVEELIRITRRWISGRDEWMGEAVRNADSAARAEQSRDAFEMDANNLRELNKSMEYTLGSISSELSRIGFNGVSAGDPVDHSQRIFTGFIEAITELRELRDKVTSLRALKIEPVSMVAAAWNALRAADVHTEDHATLADAIGFLGRQLTEVSNIASDLSDTITKSWLALGAHSFGFEANASLSEAISKLSRELTKAQNEVEVVRSETHTEFINGVLTVHTEGTTVIIVDRNT